MAVGRRRLPVGCWLLAVGCWLSAVGCRLSAVGRSLDRSAWLLMQDTNRIHSVVGAVSIVTARRA